MEILCFCLPKTKKKMTPGITVYSPKIHYKMRSCWKICRCWSPTALFKEIKWVGFEPQLLFSAFSTIFLNMISNGISCLHGLYCQEFTVLQILFFWTRNFNWKHFLMIVLLQQAAFRKWLIYSLPYCYNNTSYGQFSCCDDPIFSRDLKNLSQL